MWRELARNREWNDCTWPVEARFLAACVDDSAKRTWEEPVPPKTLAALSPDDRYQGHVAWQMRMEQTMYQFQRELREVRYVLYAFGSGLLLALILIALLIGSKFFGSAEVVHFAQAVFR